MSLGPFPLAGASEHDPLGRYEAAPMLDLGQRLHIATYGFPEETIDYRLAGHILFNRRQLLPDLRQLPNEWIREGIYHVQTLVGSGSVSGFKQPTTALFWDYWNHVLSHFPDVSVHIVLTVRSPHAIASSYLAHDARSRRIEDAYDLIAAYYSSLVQVQESWKGPLSVVRFTPEHYAGDLRTALEACGVPFDESAITGAYDPARIGGESLKVDHPVEGMYELFLDMS